MSRLRTPFLILIGFYSLLLFAPMGFCQSWISSVSVAATDTTAVVSWVTVVPANSQVKYGTSQRYSKQSPLDTKLVTAHSATLTSLTASTQYHFRILSADATTVLVTSLDAVFTTKAGAIVVTVTPTTANVVSGGTQQFTAQVSNSDNQSVTWTVTAGTVSASGLFTAPVVTKNTAVTLKATSVADNTKSASAAITVTPTAAGTLTANPTSLAFGNTQVGSKSNLFEVLTNTGAAAVTISQANVTGAAFSISGLTLPTTLTSGQSVTFTTTFTPTGSGSASGTLSIVSNASNSPLGISLSGTGTSSGQLAVSPTSLNFGTVTIGASASLNASLTASGATVTISSASSSNGEYVLSGVTFPATITAGQSLPFTVTFKPNASGTATGSLTFICNAGNSPTVETLTGVGQAAAQHWVTLAWNTDSGAVTYNVYRKLPTDPSYTQITSGDATTSYTDNNVTAGLTYDYVVTGVDGGGHESGYSNMAAVTVPSP